MTRLLDLVARGPIWTCGLRFLVRHPAAVSVCVVASTALVLAAPVDRDHAARITRGSIYRLDTGDVLHDAAPDVDPVVAPSAEPPGSDDSLRAGAGGGHRPEAQPAALSTVRPDQRAVSIGPRSTPGLPVSPRSGRSRGRAPPLH